MSNRRLNILAASAIAISWACMLGAALVHGVEPLRPIPPAPGDTDPIRQLTWERDAARAELKKCKERESDGAAFAIAIVLSIIVPAAVCYPLGAWVAKRRRPKNFYCESPDWKA